MYYIYVCVCVCVCVYFKENIGMDWTCIGRYRSVGIAIRYGLGRPGIKSRLGRDFVRRPEQPWGPISVLYNGHQVTFQG